MKFLIPTQADDTHALYIKLALESLGHDVRLIFTADQPTRLKNSILIDNDTYQWRSTDKYSSVIDHHYDVVWWRRARKPYLPHHASHPEDYRFVLKENMLFYESITDTIANKAWWVNDKIASMRAGSKMFQLQKAVESGMQIPPTLCSNDPQDIRYFILRYEDDGVIYKPLCSNCWFEKNRMKIAYTSKVSFIDLPKNNLLQLSPGIFQKEIKKKYELRVTCFGDYIVAAKLNSQAHSEGLVDWRAIPVGKMELEPYVLPTSLQEKLKIFMKKMGLVFGTLDFIVNEDHEYIFLEINEQGQFLWIDEYSNDFNMLDIFINFLCSPNRIFKWNPKNYRHALNDYRSEVERLLVLNRERHVDLNRDPQPIMLSQVQQAQ
jgi:glutathione synthase/RimK-type ligase-like ATP-grasp enzyme